MQGDSADGTSGRGMYGRNGWIRLNQLNRLHQLNHLDQLYQLNQLNPPD